jgi:hypothetical protein
MVAATAGVAAETVVLHYDDVNVGTGRVSSDAELSQLIDCFGSASGEPHVTMTVRCDGDASVLPLDRVSDVGYLAGRVDARDRRIHNWSGADVASLAAAASRVAEAVVAAPSCTAPSSPAPHRLTLPPVSGAVSHAATTPLSVSHAVTACPVPTSHVTAATVSIPTIPPAAVVPTPSLGIGIGIDTPAVETLDVVDDDATQCTVCSVALRGECVGHECMEPRCDVVLCDACAAAGKHPHHRKRQRTGRRAAAAAAAAPPPMPTAPQPRDSVTSGAAVGAASTPLPGTSAVAHVPAAVAPHLPSVHGGGCSGPAHDPLAAPALDCQYVAEVSGSTSAVVRVGAGVLLVRVFRLRNVGTERWPAGCRVTFVGGEPMECVCGGGALPDAVHVDDDVDVRVMLRVPRALGRHTSRWMLTTPSGTTFGAVIYVTVDVV